MGTKVEAWQAEDGSLFVKDFDLSTLKCTGKDFDKWDD